MIIEFQATSYEHMCELASSFEENTLRYSVTRVIQPDNSYWVRVQEKRDAS